jgi:hypothetical protein
MARQHENGGRIQPSLAQREKVFPGGVLRHH